MILWSTSWARWTGAADATGGGGAAGRRYGWNFGTSRRAVQFSMPATNTSVCASALPPWIAFTTSCSVTGPTCCPPIAMYHCAVEDMSSPL